MTYKELVNRLNPYGLQDYLKATKHWPKLKNKKTCFNLKGKKYKICGNLIPRIQADK
jgi:hypothetical protein